MNPEEGESGVSEEEVVDDEIRTLLLPVLISAANPGISPELGSIVMAL